MPSRPRRPKPVTVDDGALPELERRLAQQRAQARRAWRRYLAADERADSITSNRAHRDWSDAVEDALSIIEEISK